MATINHNILHQFFHLPAFASHLLNGRLDEFVRRQIEWSKSLNIPLLTLLSHYTEEQLLELTKRSATELLTYIADNKAAEYISLSIDKWEQNTLPSIAKESVQAEDITKVAYLRKKVFLSFIPDYCTTVEGSLSLIGEIDLFLMEWETASSKTYIELLQNKIDEHAHFIEKITNTTPGIIYVYDVALHKEVYTNKTVTEVIGYTAEEIVNLGAQFVQQLIHPEDVEQLRKYEQEFSSVRDGEIKSVKYRIKNKAGNYIWMRAYETAFKRSSEGALIQKIGIAIDVNTQVETAQKLRQSEALYKQAEALSHIGSWSYDIAEDKVNWSDEMYRIFRMELGSPINFERYQSLLHPEDKPRILEHIQTSLQTLEPYRFTHRIVLQDGTEKHLLANGSIIVGTEGKPAKIIGTTQDITERYALVERLQHSENLYKQAQALSHLGNWSYNMYTEEFTWSDEMYRIYNLPIGQKISIREWESFIHPDDKEGVLMYSKEVREKKLRYDRMHRIILKDGTIKTIHRKGDFVFDKLGNVTEMIGTTQNVTEQQKMQQELWENQQFINKIANATPSIIAAYNIHTGNYSFISHGLTKLLGWDPHEAKEQGIPFFLSIIHPDDLPQLMKENEQTLEEANKGSGEVKEFVYRMKHRNGDYRWIRTYGTVFDRNAAGQVENILNISLDITDQVVANKKIEEQELFIQQVADASPTILYIFDIPSNCIDYVNKEIYFVLGYSTDEIQGMGSGVVTELYHPEDIYLLPERRESDKKFQHINSMIQYECRVKSKDGEWKWLLVREVIFKNAEGDKPTQILGAALDITKRKEMERSLLQNSFQLEQSNASLEEFAYVASHDLKEPLRKISTFGDRLVTTQADKLTSDGQIYLKKIVDASQRMQLMINDLLSISMISGNRSYELYSLQTVLDDAKATLEYKIEQKAAVVEGANLPETHIVVSQFRQLFQNLLSNSLKFTKEGVQPRITISSDYLLPEELSSYQLTAADRYLRLQFTDNGIGFEEEYAAKIFQIFQRLHGRSEYEGTGIGLAICKKIVEHHGGVIFASGKPDVGATFTIILPS